MSWTIAEVSEGDLTPGQAVIRFISSWEAIIRGLNISLVGLFIVQISSSLRHVNSTDQSQENTTPIEYRCHHLSKYLIYLFELFWTVLNLNRNPCCSFWCRKWSRHTSELCTVRLLLLILTHPNKALCNVIYEHVYILDELFYLYKLYLDLVFSDLAVTVNDLLVPVNVLIPRIRFLRQPECRSL